MKIIVLFGGFSTEREISFKTAESVYNTLQKKYNTIAIDTAYPDKKIDDFSYVKSDKPCASHIKNLIKRIEDETPDRIFLALHGNEGENGQFQAVLELCNIQFYSSKSRASALSMDKYRSKIVIEKAEITTAKSVFINKEMMKDKDHVRSLTSDFQFPFVFKANAQGSSVGVFILRSMDEFDKAYESILKLEDDAVLEKFIKGRELSVPVLKNRALTPVEIAPKSGFYDYENKYSDGKTDHYCPARISEEDLSFVKGLALRAHQEIGCEGYSRVDFIHGEDGKFYFLEINSLPGMTKLSLLPESANYEGISFIELLEQILDIEKDK
ncbi:MAG: D-alanine--D-alanine ligase [Candidatus Delongbacteria bacterium]|nr:D-alanine--D-alanine ligase [Candidatus Delongbacteria bacterium]MBN2835636.1 D-alanine--D-alanine ligase [Candidatus Delongbacteria bacterium]